MERRFHQQSLTSQGNKITGLASPVYDGSAGTEYELWENTFERFAEGAFSKHLTTNPDVVALFNHDSNLVLGRTPDTLQLRQDKQGLHYEIDLPDTQVAQDLKKSIGRGDIRGSSFGFVPTDVEWRTEGDKDIRLIHAAKVFDVSPVTMPAYGNSSVGLRSMEERKSLENERNQFRERLDTEKRLATINTVCAQVRTKR